MLCPAPEVTASASETNICPGESVDLFSSANIASAQPPTLLSEDFNSAAVGSTSGPNGWTTTNNSSGGSPANAAWTIRENNYNNGTIFRSNDNSNFYLSDSDAQGSGSTTSTNLISPSINTVGYTDLQLEFYHYYRDYASTAFVEVSTNGSTWNTIRTYDSSDGSSTSFSHETISLNGYIGNPTLFIRFRYEANWGYYWAIDNVEVTGTPASAATMNWTSSPSGFTSNIANPTGVYPTETTTYTATYTDPDTGCDGYETVTVNVYPTPDATISADYCVVSPKIRLTTGSGFASYDWQPLPPGETNTEYIDVDLAGIYTVTVTDANGCTGTASINVSNELVVNGDFSAGNVGFTTPPTGGNFYQYVVDNPFVNNELWPEGYYGIGNNANNYHSNFWGVDHTDGTGNFMIVNGFPGSPQPIVWQQTLTVEPNTDYYFSAWAISLNSAGNDAQLRFSINGTQLGTIADLTLVPGVSNASNSWQPGGRFYGIWNSGSNTTAVVDIVDLQTALGGNDFGLDDISFGILDPSPADIEPSASTEICSGDTVYLYANVTGGKEPITYSWTGPNGFTSSDENPIIPNATEAYDGTYTLEVTDWYGCDITPETINVTVYSQATVDAGEDQVVCSISPQVTLNGTIGGAANQCYLVNQWNRNF